MNEADTRANLIDPLLADCGWGATADSKIFREYQITAGRIQSGGGRRSRLRQGRTENNAAADQGRRQ